jgi:hypothetical protein
VNTRGGASLIINTEILTRTRLFHFLIQPQVHVATCLQLKLLSYSYMSSSEIVDEAQRSKRSKQVMEPPPQPALAHSPPAPILKPQPEVSRTETNQRSSKDEPAFVPLSKAKSSEAVGIFSLLQTATFFSPSTSIAIPHSALFREKKFPTNLCFAFWVYPVRGKVRSLTIFSSVLFFSLEFEKALYVGTRVIFSLVFCLLTYFVRCHYQALPGRSHGTDRTVLLRNY